MRFYKALLITNCDRFTRNVKRNQNINETRSAIAQQKTAWQDPLKAQSSSCHTEFQIGPYDRFILFEYRFTAKAGISLHTQSIGQEMNEANFIPKVITLKACYFES